MFFVQQYTRKEKYHGEMAIRFIVSDDYSDLLKTDAQLSITEDDYVDIFSIGATEIKIESDGDKFAVSNMDLTINSTACRKTEEKNALYFCLECKDRNILRYAAKFFLEESGGSFEEPSVDNMEFVGIFDAEVDADDLTWSGSEYDENISPEREYSFNIRSLDYSLLEKASMTGDVYKVVDGDEERISNIYERIDHDTDILPLAGEELPEVQYSPLKTDKNACRDAYASQVAAGEPDRRCRLLNLISLYDVLRMYLDKAEAIINDIDGTSISFVLSESSLGFKVAPLKYTAYSLTDLYGSESGWKSTHDEWMQSYAALKSFYNDALNLLELKISDTDNGSGWSNPFIHRRMINPEFGFPEESQRSDEDKSIISNEKEYSYKALSNVAELLSKTARHFGCYLFFEYETATQINIKFISYAAVGEEDVIELKDAEEAGISTKSEVSDEANHYYGTSNNYAANGIDWFFNKMQSGSYALSDGSDLKATDKFHELKDKIEEYEKQNNADTERLLLTTSTTLETRSVPGKPSLQPFHPVNCIIEGRFPSGPNTYQALYRERLTTAIYVKAVKSGVNYLPSGTDIWSPAGSVFAKIDGENVGGSEYLLDDYINAIKGRDRRYYETEYEITVPYWSGFKKDGAETWKNLKLFRRIRINETIRRYNSVSGQWEDYTPDEGEEFTVMGIERNPDYPETKVKLQKTSRYSYASYDGTPDDPLIFGFILPWHLRNQEEGETEEVVYSETILAGDAVMFDPDTEKLVLAVPEKEYFTYNVGIALVDGVEDDIGLVQWSGIIRDDGYNFDTTKQLFVSRKYYSTLHNINQDCSDIPSGSDDMIIHLGMPLGPDSFLLDVHKFPFYES